MAERPLTPALCLVFAALAGMQLNAAEASTPAATSTAAPAAPAAAPAAAQADSSSATRQSADVPPEVRELRKAIRIFREETERLGARDSGERGDKRQRNASQAAIWHGRVFEYIRNNALDAVPHEVVQNGGERNILRRNQFGISVNGPVVIPKLYDGRRKTFFTFSYEGTREKVGRSYLRTIPTAPQRGGDFSDLVNKGGKPVTVYDPQSTSLNAGFDPSQPVSMGNLEYNREAFPNNQIPLSRLDAVALKAGEHYPLPNTSIGPFLSNNFWMNPSETNTPDGVITRIDHNLFKRHKITVDVNVSKGFQGQPRYYETIGNPGRPDRNFLDRRLQLRETYAISPTTVYTGSLELSSHAVETSGLSDGVDIPKELGFEGVEGAVFPGLRFRNYFGLGPSPGSYLRNAWNTYETGHQFSLRTGKQSWSWSAQLRRREVNTFELESPSGSLAFNDFLTGLPGITNTGNAYASFLLGMPYSAEVTDQPQPAYLRQTNIDLAARNSIELSENLTISVSLDFDIETPRVEKYDRQSTIDLDAVNPVNGRPGALVFANRDGYGRAFQPVRATAEPRLGFSWSPTAKRNTVVRASFMHYYTGVPLEEGVFGTQGFIRRRKPLSSNYQLSPAILLQDGFPGNDLPLPDLRAEAANGTDADLIPASGKQPRYRYLYLGLEHRLPAGMTLRASGRTYRGKNMLIDSSVAGFNRIPLEALQYRDELNNEAFRASLRPYPQYQQIMTQRMYAAGKYLYDIAELSVEKRTGQGISLDVGYEFRKRWDNYSGPGAQNPFDLSTEWAPTAGNRPHRFSVNYVYELPFGQGKPMLNDTGLISKILGDWSLSGFTNVYSGDPIVLTPEFNNTGGIVPYLRVNSVSGVDPKPDNPGPEMWFNPAAFAHPDDFTIGNVPRTHPTLRNPQWQNHDLAVTKRVPLSAEKSLEVLLQSFNFLNLANWNDPDAQIGTAAAPNVNAGRIIGSRGGRVLQLGMRYNF